jgi:hypothetical protein
MSPRALKLISVNYNYRSVRRWFVTRIVLPRTPSARTQFADVLVLRVTAFVVTNPTVSLNAPSNAVAVQPVARISPLEQNYPAIPTSIEISPFVHFYS